MKAGVLTEMYQGTGYSFKYEPDYLLSGHPPVSANLPKKEVAFKSDSLFPFFSNMIPEGANREGICRALKIDKKDYFGILSAMANKDFIGAINIRTSCHD